MRTADLYSFIMARDARRKYRLALAHPKKNGQLPPKPVPDEILDTYRFCNVRRNDDRVTQDLLSDWYPRLMYSADIWFAAVVARLFNNTEALFAIRDVTLPYNQVKMKSALHKRAQAGKKNFNAAYIVSTNGIAMDKVEYLLTRVLLPLWKDRKRFTGHFSLDDFHKLLVQYDGMGSFIAAQVVADLKYVGGSGLEQADDFYTWAASGPGSRRGLNRVMERPVDNPWREDMWRSALAELRSAILPMLRNDAYLRMLTAQDLQNCLCEFDKYERARLGEGRPKQLYVPFKEKQDGARASHS